ncbi:uncharacterized protein EI97DRAFT_450212 [Westerdykella ornata]|uniref:C2H2-type domain-containing protein n=1 Tax=Westerdykella ornata TaxID=318751 RepID=A0A6A6JKY7_WESOR|nr:uncharacterized protein EI97DRAFT_450212 [Westerdykella ornata]KAF2276356.1 hypothetical protein EI97DRAFT_450212 [Westerdykella ornata]
MGDCPVTGSSPINTIHERKISLSSNANSTIPTPVSMGPLSPHLSPSPSRRHSTASSQGQPILSPSAAPSQDGEEEYSQKHRSFKRAEEPRRNQDGKLICVKPTCIGVTFDRKCEWSKHMDKHDRPYICTAKGCEKLRGFTYSGGLLRHEREVHKLHGGTKEPLFCPFPDCKRSSGSGFTRKENQQEHIRRVHTRSSTPSETGNERLPKADSPQQTTTQSETAPLTHLKRKRIAEREYSHEEGPISLHEENKRLRRQLQEKDAVIQRLQARLKELTHAP